MLRSLTLSTCLMAGGASAKTMNITFTGTILSGTDTFGYFGASGTDLTGQGYTLKFTYDTALGSYTHGMWDNPRVRTTDDQADGGDYMGNTNPVVATQLTVLCRTSSFSFNHDGSVDARTTTDHFGGIRYS